MTPVCIFCAGEIFRGPSLLDGTPALVWVHAENLLAVCPPPFPPRFAELGAYLTRAADAAEAAELAAAAEAPAGGAGPACWCTAYHFTDLDGREVCTHSCHDGDLDPGDDDDGEDSPLVMFAEGKTADPHVFGPVDGPAQGGALDEQEPWWSERQLAGVELSMAGAAAWAATQAAEQQLRLRDELARIERLAFAGAIDPAGYIRGLQLVFDSAVTTTAAPSIEDEAAPAPQVDHPWVTIDRCELDPSVPGGRRWWLYLRRGR